MLPRTPRTPITPCTLGLTALLAAAGLANAQTGFTISGAMSNFDCSNHCDYDCDEMEVDIYGIHPEDVMHTYMNPNYGSPTVTLSTDGTYTVVDYRNPQHLTAVNSVEHFGITIRGAVYYGPAPYHPTRVRWFRNGQPATVNGQVPNPAGGTSPATQPLMPTISAAIIGGAGSNVTLTVTNNDTTQPIWIKRRATVTQGEVTLESLMSNNPVVTNTIQIDSGPVMLAAGQAMTAASDLVEVESEQSAIFAAEYFQNVVNSDPFFPNQNTPGPELGNVMTATIASPVLTCAHSIPTITSQPASVTVAANSRVDLRVSGQGDDTTPLTYVWMKQGVAISDGNGISGSATNHLTISHLTHATEGFYDVRITNTCATILSDTALVFITGDNVAPTHVTPTCPAITTQPQPALSCPGSSASFSVAATGTGPLTYQWRANSTGGAPTNLTDGPRVSGSTTATLTLTGLTSADAASYSCTVFNSCGSITSQPAALRVNTADFNNDGDSGTDLDIEAFFACLAGNCCPTCASADFNADGDVGTDLDIEAFFRVLSGGPC